MVDGRAKGKAWERELADMLTNLYAEKFMRVPNSGAMVGGSNNYMMNILAEHQIRMYKGDIIPGPSFKKLNLEAKNYGSFNFHQLLLGEEVKLLDAWITQTLSSEQTGDFSLICIKVTRRGEYVMFKKQHLSDFKVETFVIYKDWVFTNLNKFFETNKEKIRELSGGLTPIVNPSV